MASGRDFDANDRDGSEPVVIVSTALAHRYFPNGDAVGRRLKLAGPVWLKIVGVAGDVRYREWQTARYDVYVPFQQRAQHLIAIRPRGALAVAVVSGGIRIAHGIEPGYGLVLGVCLRGQEAVDDFLFPNGV